MTTDNTSRVVTREEFEQFKTKVQEELIGGTQVTPDGLKQRMTAIERSLKNIDGDGELRKLLATIDPKDLESMKIDIVLLKDNQVQDGQSLTATVASHSRIFWHIGLGALSVLALAIATAVGVTR